MKDGEKTLGKAFELLELVGASRNGLRAAALLQQSGLAKSTLFRLLKYLTARGYLHSADGVYTLGVTFLRLAGEASRQNLLSRVAHPYLVRLSDATSETVHLAERRGTRAIYVDKVEGSRSVRMGSLIGQASAMHCTGVGKAVLAWLPPAELSATVDTMEFTLHTPSTIGDPAALRRELEQVRAAGYAVDDCEHEPGVYCVAAPVFGPGGAGGTGVPGGPGGDTRGPVAGAVSISGSELYMRAASAELAEQVKACAASITAALTQL